jgi:hypothetical protein
VVLSVSSFLVVAGSDLVALVPSRVANGGDEALQVLKPPVVVEGFALSLIWHERTHDHAAHRWIRDSLGRMGETDARRRKVRVRRDAGAEFTWQDADFMPGRGHMERRQISQPLTNGTAVANSASPHSASGGASPPLVR